MGIVGVPLDPRDPRSLVPPDGRQRGAMGSFRGRPGAELPQVVLDESDDGPSRCGMFLHYLWKLSSCLCSHVTLVSLVIAYCILGAVTFEKLEAANERTVKQNITYMRSNVTEDLWLLTTETRVLHQDNWTQSAIERLMAFETDLLRAMRKEGWDGSEDPEQLQWTFAGALFYSIIVITTIGYGHIAPKTHLGKVVTIFYAILGIPLMLLCLSNIGDVMAHSFRFLYWRVCCFVCTRGPHPQQRRGRFVRGARPSTRSNRTASFRRSGRVSTRSADSALGMSMRSSHSDTECRYPEDRDLGQRVSQMSRYPDADRIAAHQLRSVGGAAMAGVPLSHAGPVLFNKYALDREESGRARDGQRRLRAQSVGREGRRRGPGPVHGGSLPRQHRLAAERGMPPAIQMQPMPSPGPIRDPIKAQRGSAYGYAANRRLAELSHPAVRTPSPRIMSPMGFGLNRQFLRPEDPADYVDYDGEADWEPGAGPGRLRPVPIWLCVFLVVSYIFGGAFLFSGWEGWPFLDSAYFCFITLTTIGFGDFVPAQRVTDNAEVSIALCSLYLLFGIALLAMSFNLVQEEVLSSVRAVAKRLGIIKGDPDDD